MKKIKDTEMNSSKISAFTFLMSFLVYNHCYAQDTITYKLKIYAKNSEGINILQASKKDSKNKCCWVSIQESKEKGFTDRKGIAKLSLLKKRFSAGAKINITVDKPWWRIESPRNGFTRLPNNPAEIIEVILVQNQGLSKKAINRNTFFHTVQIFTTKYPEKAAEMARSLRNRGFDAYKVKSLKPQSVSLEYEAVVIVGKFYNRQDALKKKEEVIRNTDYRNVFVRKMYE